MRRTVDPDIYRPISLTALEGTKYTCDVVFAGGAKTRGSEMLAAVSRLEGVKLLLHGRGWDRGRFGRELGRLQRGWVRGDYYAGDLCGAKIAICMLNEGVGDSHTTRTFELPSCGVFMLAERTPAHLALFREGVEAAHFSSTEELVDQVRFYLGHDDERQWIAEQGLRHVRELRCTWRERLAELLSKIQTQTTRH